MWISCQICLIPRIYYSGGQSQGRRRKWGWWSSGQSQILVWSCSTFWGSLTSINGSSRVTVRLPHPWPNWLLLLWSSAGQLRQTQLLISLRNCLLPEILRDNSWWTWMLQVWITVCTPVPSSSVVSLPQSEITTWGIGSWEWRDWLEWAEQLFIVWTDHKNLPYIKSAMRLNSRQARWALFFRRFSFSYRPGTRNIKPEALSRQFSPSEPEAAPDTILPAGRVITVLNWDIERVVREALIWEPDPGKGPRNRLFVPSTVLRFCIGSLWLSGHVTLEQTVPYLPFTDTSGGPHWTLTHRLVLPRVPYVPGAKPHIRHWLVWSTPCWSPGGLGFT